MQGSRVAAVFAHLRLLVDVPAPGADDRCAQVHVRSLNTTFPSSPDSLPLCRVLYVNSMTFTWSCPACNGVMEPGIRQCIQCQMTSPGRSRFGRALPWELICRVPVCSFFVRGLSGRRRRDGLRQCLLQQRAANLVRAFVRDSLVWRCSCPVRVPVCGAGSCSASAPASGPSVASWLRATDNCCTCARHRRTKKVRTHVHASSLSR